MPRAAVETAGEDARRAVEVALEESAAGDRAVEISDGEPWGTGRGEDRCSDIEAKEIGYGRVGKAGFNELSLWMQSGPAPSECGQSGEMMENKNPSRD